MGCRPSHQTGAVMGVLPQWQVLLEGVYPGSWVWHLKSQPLLAFIQAIMQESGQGSYDRAWGRGTHGGLDVKVQENKV